MRKLIAFLVLALLIGCNTSDDCAYTTDPGDIVEQGTMQPIDVSAIISSNNYEVKIEKDSLNDHLFTIIKKDSLYCIIEPDGQLLAICYSFTTVKDVVYEYVKLNK